MLMASAVIFFIASVEAAAMAFNTDPVTIDPPDIGPIGKRAVAKDHVDAIEGNAGLFVHDLRKDRVGSGADILRA